MATSLVGVLRGGPSAEYEVSLRTGQAVLDNLPSAYEGRDILIDKNGVWHWQGLPAYPQELLPRLDVVFNALHGEYGEDGRVQSLLDTLGTPYTGSRTFASAVAMKKAMAKEVLARAGLKTPFGLVVSAENDEAAAARLVFAKVGPPWVVKPADRGSSVGVSLVRHFADLPAAIDRARQVSPQVLAEEYIAGKEITCGVLDEFRGANQVHGPVRAAPVGASLGAN